MDKNAKIALGVVAAGAVGYLLLKKGDKAPVVAQPASPGAPSSPSSPSAPSAVYMPTDTGYQDSNPNAVIDPISRSFADEAAKRLDTYLANYAVASTQNVALDTFAVGAMKLPPGKAVSDPNSLVPAAVRLLVQNGYDVLVAYDVGQAVMAEDPSKVTQNIAMFATKNPAMVQTLLHRGAYVYRTGAKTLTT